ncbi:MAG: sulfate ABC transporter permease subunit CysT [Puniceicoccales bacterium]|jgi:sulfate transport system permease protein|nr:sulfate ABC transporter permease subunit CysT [Puniceicoccales bacterium]
MRLGLRKQHGVIPGFHLSLGFTTFYLGLVVLIPLSAVFLRASGLSWPEFCAAAFGERELNAYRVTFLTAFCAAAINAIFGTILAWVLERYTFPLRRLVDALVDLPFALPTAVAGIALTAIYGKNGWIGRWLDPEGAFFSIHKLEFLGLEFSGVRVAYSSIGIFVAMAFVGLPFVVRTLQPVIAELEPDMEESAATLGASRLFILWKVILPQLVPAILTGVALAFARALGEYGSIVFISGNKPNETEIAALRIITKLEEESGASGTLAPYSTATAVALVMLTASFLLLLLVNILQRWSRRLAVPPQRK